MPEYLAGPMPPNTDVAARWEESRRRRRMLTGAWHEDLRRVLQREYEPTRRRRLGRPDTTKNLFRSTISQLAILYDRVPLVSHEDAGAVERMQAIASDSGLWQLACTLQQLTLGQREAMYRLSVLEGGALQVRVVPVDLSHAVASPDTPDTPHTVYEYRLRTWNDRTVWTRDCFTIEDPANPVWRIETDDGRLDLSEVYGLPAGGVIGKDYPHRYASAAPFLPYTLYHATRTGSLFDSYRGIELVDGSLAVSGLLTQWKHVVRDASWPQRYGVDVEVAGASTDENGDAFVTTDEAAILNFRSSNPGVNGSLGQFAAGGDPSTLLEAIHAYANDVAADFDITPADLSRVHNSRSGYAVEVTREGQRAAQRRFEPQFQRGDLETLRKIAAMMGLPEDGWSIQYLGLPLSMQERKALMDEHKLRAEMGVTSRAALLARLEGITEDQARARLAQFRIDDAT